MSIPQASGGYALGPGEGEAVWFNGGLGLLKATAKLTDGNFAAMELLNTTRRHLVAAHRSRNSARGGRLSG